LKLSNNFKDSSVFIGKVINAHGIRGMLKVFSEVEDTLLALDSKVHILFVDGKTETYTIQEVRRLGRKLLVLFQEVDNRTQAESLIGASMYLDRFSFPSLEENVYYWFDIQGLQVFNEKNEYLGCVESIISTPGNDIYVVNNGSTEIMIPAIESVVKNIDLSQKKMQVELLEEI
jgi:16S rRNA processing protein RimM